MNHLTEDELIDRRYGECSAEVERHLASCRECAEAFAALRRTLEEVESIEPPLRGDDYEESVWRTLADKLPALSRPASRRFALGFGLGLWRGLAYGAGVAVLIAGAFYAGRIFEQHKKQQTVAQQKQAPPQIKQPVFVVVLSDHLERSERLLVELKHVDASNSEMMPPLRDEARSLLDANHKCRHDAEQGDDPELRSALDRLDVLLGELANQPGGLNAGAITRLQDEMTSDRLLFEVRVLRSRIPNRQGGKTPRTTGGTA
jgi:hypothetical protein